MSEGDRDYIGDQIGWSVRRMLPPNPELRKADRAIMSHLPLPIARLVALFRFNHGLLPTPDDPTRLIDGLSSALGTSYADQYGEKHHFNTVIMPGVDHPVISHSSSFHPGQHELRIRWDKQLEWAHRISDRFEEKPSSVLRDERQEAITIIAMQSALNDSIEKSKPEFIRRGLPIPEKLIDSEASSPI